MHHARPKTSRHPLALVLLLAPIACGDDAAADDELGSDTSTTTIGGSEGGDSESAGGQDAATTGDATTGGDTTGDATTGGDTTGDATTGNTTGGDTTGDGSGDTTGGDTTTGEGDGNGDAMDCLDLGGDCCPPNPAADAVLSGTVWAPNGVIPVSGALVYTTAQPPEPIPDHVYCAQCLELTCGVQDYTLTDADGTFSVQAQSGDKYLVVEKGQFMRVSPITVAAGNTVLLDEHTELPGEWNPNEGLYIPKIAVANGSFDRLEDALGKLGLGDTMIGNFEERLVPNTENFELWNNGKDPAEDGLTSKGTFQQLVTDPAALAQYHVIFVPCSSDDYIAALDDPQVIANIRQWVEDGGRWYVADWANEWLARPFPEYQDFYDNGSNYDLQAYDSLADVLDDGLLAWLEALPGPLKDINPLNDELHPTLFNLPKVPTVDNWSGIRHPLPAVLVDDGMGNMVDVGHKPWLEGPGGGGNIAPNDVHPLTVTAQYGCGKIQFTSYHAAEFFNYVGLSPQELVLMYTILEIGVCQANLPAPQ